VFAKPPRPGEAKTRLAAELGDEVATRLARAFVLDTWALVGSLEWADPILATTEVTDPFWADLPGATIWPQGGGDLGDRMERVLCRALETHQAAIVIGSDVPGVPLAALRQARTTLRFADTVIGPADDGGFYLIGCRRPCPVDLFRGIAWSTDRTRVHTEDRLRSLGLSVIQVAPWFDIDRVDDLRRLRVLGDRLRQSAPETARILESLSLDPAPEGS
jgi:rSAM/selenodomain-associated transferase 1